jgi:hypothetical protein
MGFQNPQYMKELEMNHHTVIPIVPETLELITKLNDGVCPEIEKGTTYYVYNGESEPAKIISIGDYYDNLYYFMEEIEVFKVYAMTDEMTV